MTLSDYQRSFNGLTLGDGTDYILIEESGLEGFEVSSGSKPIPREDGSIPGLHLVDQKTVVVPFEVVGDPETEIAPAVNAAKSALTPSKSTERQYRFKNPGDDEKFVWARPLRFERSRTLEGSLGLDRFVVALELADPRIYSVEQFSTLVDIFEATGGGFNLPVAELPLNMTEASQALAVANNAGSRDAYPLIRFQFPSGGSGTCTGVQLENLTNGDLLDIDTTLVAGQTLTADQDALIRATGESVIHIDGSSRYGDWVPPRDPFRLSSGDNTLKFEVTGTSTDVVCLVTWRNTD